MREESYDIMDGSGKYTGRTKPRGLVHRDGDWHRTAHIWVMNFADELLLQRRSPKKDSFPNMLDVSAAGHISAGETPIEGALRELKEELGISANPTDLNLLGTVKMQSVQPNYFNNEFVDIYLYHTSLSADQMTPQPDEVAEIFFVPLAELKHMVQEKDPELLAHDVEYELLFKYLDNKSI